MEVGRLEELHRDLVNVYARQWIEFCRGDGSTLFDVNGGDYIDFGGGIGVNSIGYSHPRYLDAISAQARSLVHMHNSFANSLSARLASSIKTLAGYDGSVFFSNSGAEANECAIKMARRYGESRHRNCWEIITLRNSFHGRTMATLTASGQEILHTHFFPLLEGFKVADNFEEVMRLCDENTCAVMFELVQGEGGVYNFDIPSVQTLAKFLKSKGILLIIDEIQTGVYRCGEFIASKIYDIEPDIICLAKGLGGGMPIGATFTKLRDVLKIGDHGSTFGGNRISCAASLCVLDILSEYHGNGGLKRAIQYFNCRIREFFEEFQDLFIEVSGMGFMRGLIARTVDIQDRFIQMALDHGVVILKSGRNVVRFLPPLLISQREIDEGFIRLRAASRNLKSQL